MQWSISETVNARASNLSHCVLYPWKLTSRDFWSSRNERKLKNIDYYRNQTCAIVFCTPENLLARDFLSSRNKRKPLSWLKHDLRKCSRVSQKWWLLVLPNLSHRVLYPWKLTSRDFWSSRNERKPLSQLNQVFWENAVEYLRNSECQSFQILAIVFYAPMKTY